MEIAKAAAPLTRSSGLSVAAGGRVLTTGGVDRTEQSYSTCRYTGFSHGLADCSDRPPGSTSSTSCRAWPCSADQTPTSCSGAIRSLGALTASVSPAFWLDGPGSCHTGPTYFRKSGIGAFLVDLGNLAQSGLEPHCDAVQDRLEAITNHLNGIGELADWEVTPDAAFHEFRQHYVHWDDQRTPQARRDAMERVRVAKWVVAEKLRQPQNLLFQQDLDEPMDNILDELDALADLGGGQLFLRVRVAVNRCRQRLNV